MARNNFKFGSRNAGYQRAIHHWVCVTCRKSWEEKKPGFCDKCQGRELWHFDSRAEFLRFRELELLERHNAIAGLECHKRFELTGMDKLGNPFIVGYYESDFCYHEPGGAYVVEDVKPQSERAQSELFKWKKKFFEKQYKIKLTITRRG